MLLDPLSPEELLELSHSQNFDFIIEEDRRITISLLIMAYQGDERTMDVCLFFSHLKVPDDIFLESTETALIIIEDVLNPELSETYAKTLLQQNLARDEISSPLWFYLARSPFGKSDDFKNLLLTYFSHDSAYFSEIMDKTLDPEFLPIIEQELKRLVPFVKYLPLYENSHEVILSHDNWLRIGSAYGRIRKRKGDVKIESVISFLQETFFPCIPETQDEWLRSASEDLKKEFLSESRIYHEHFEVV